MDALPPFSARNRGAHAQIDNDFPESARVGLLHILQEGIRANYIDSWHRVLAEIQRIARFSPQECKSTNDARAFSETFLSDLPWEKVYDFCERIHGHLAKEVGGHDFHGEYYVTESRSEVQAHFAREFQRLFLEENLAFEFKEGSVQRRGRRHTIDRVSRAEVVLGDPRLDGSRKHFVKAQNYFRDASNPDPENVVKEAVCAVEAAAKALFPEAKAATLDDVVKWLTGPKVALLPKALGTTIIGLYGFRNSGEGVAHGGATGGLTTMGIAEYALAAAASQIIMLVDIANNYETDIPF